MARLRNKRVTIKELAKQAGASKATVSHAFSGRRPVSASLKRKIHKAKTPLLGGVAIFLSFFIILYFARAELLAGDLGLNHWLGFDADPSVNLK